MNTLLLDFNELSPQGETFDVVVIGAGGAGLSAALFAAIDGARVLLVERTQYVGGTTALSAGTTWIPGTSHAAAVSQGDTIDIAGAFLSTRHRRPHAGSDAPRAAGNGAHGGRARRGELGAQVPPVSNASRLHDRTRRIDDARPGDRGAPFDGRKLGSLFALLRPPIPEFTALGGMMVDRNDIFHLLRITKSWASFRYSVEDHRPARRRPPPVSARDAPRDGQRAHREALVLARADGRTSALLVNTTVEQIAADRDGVKTVTLGQGGQRRTITVKGGVILASGGFNRHPRLRATMLPGCGHRVVPGCAGSHRRRTRPGARAGRALRGGCASPIHSGHRYRSARAPTAARRCFHTSSWTAASRDDHGEQGGAAIREREHVVPPVRDRDAAGHTRRPVPSRRS
jgi:choline dehydrogenase-like flavoprotein